VLLDVVYVCMCCSYINWFLFLLFWFHVFEIFTRVYAYGMREYWHYARFHPG